TEPTSSSPRLVAPTLVERDAMTDNPAYVARKLDDLPEILAEIFSQCAEGGMVFPFIACAISPNGTVCVFRVEPAGNEIIARRRGDRISEPMSAFGTKRT